MLYILTIYYNLTIINLILSYKKFRHYKLSFALIFYTFWGLSDTFC